MQKETTLSGRVVNKNFYPFYADQKWVKMGFELWG